MDQTERKPGHIDKLREFEQGIQRSCQVALGNQLSRQHPEEQQTKQEKLKQGKETNYETRHLPGNGEKEKKKKKERKEGRKKKEKEFKRSRESRQRYFSPETILIERLC